ncbi:solute carrier family 15 member 4-like [Uloborus diversus]|uniref:solute carrier family 15 member 4-like n=1 Tax=Uloborus diversus TaxID=327109 RepID=UPI00240A1410|nr:solute carrier family 15 member 4-like [Uloborus diversus]
MASNREREPLLSSVNSNIGYVIENNLNSQRVRIQTLHLGMLPGILILFLVLLERIGYYSLDSNLYLFLSTKFFWEHDNALSAIYIFSGTSYISSLFGGWLSDAYLGRFKTIGLAFILFTVPYWGLYYISGVSMESIKPDDLRTDPDASAPWFSEQYSEYLTPILIVAAIGTGTIKANIAPFGVEQMQRYGVHFLKLYLNWLYWCVNIGAFVAILGITYVQQIWEFQYGYVIAASSLVVATFLFWVAYPIHFHQPVSESPISRTFKVMKTAWRLSKNNNSNNSNLEVINRPSWLDMAKVRYGGKYHESVVEDVKSLKAILIVFIILIPYWLLYFQMQSTFQAQGLRMRLSLDPNNLNPEFEIPAAWLMLFNVIFLLMFIPLMNQVIYPFLSARGIEISIFTKIPIGMACAVMAMIIAGGVEWYRVQCKENVLQTIGKETYNATNVSILWQIPQYSLIGISEVFTNVGGLEFACSQAPSTMQGAVMGLYYFCNGIGNFLGIIAVHTYQKILKDLKTEADDSGLNFSYYFWLLALLQLIGLITFCFLTRDLKLRRQHSLLESSTNLQNNSSRIVPVG